MTQKEMVLAHLQQGKSITPMQALNKYGCYRLASVIKRLREADYKIETTTHPTKKFATYRMAS